MAVQRLHIDKRAPRVLADLETLGEDRLLSTREVAELLGVSRQWCEIARMKGTGPGYLRIGPRRIRYALHAVRQWLQSRAHARTSEYMPPSVAKDTKSPAE